MFKRLWLKTRWRRAARAARPSPLKDYYDAGPPDLGADAFSAGLLSLDLETSGLDSKTDEILAAGLVALEGGAVQLASARSLIVRPDRDHGTAAAALHGLSGEDGEWALGDALAAILGALKGRVLLAHNAGFDAAFLSRACRRLYGAPLVVPQICTLRLEKARLERTGFPAGSGALRLNAVRGRYNLPRYRAHHAATDAIATAELFLAQLAATGESGIPLRHLVRL